MTKTEFMAELSAALKANQSDETVKGLLEDFNDHFDEALRVGQSEVDICAMLGDPAEIAADYDKETTAEVATAEVATADTAPADDAGIAINLSHSNLSCEPTEGDEFQVEVLHNGKVVQDDTIQVRQTKSSLQVTQLRERDYIRLLFRAFIWEEVCVRVPRGFNGDMSVNMVSGNMRLNRVTIQGSLDCELTSGNVEMTQVAADEAITVRSRSGNIILENCEGELSAHCRSGNVGVRAHKGNVLRAASSSGNVRVDADVFNKDCALEVKSGNLRLDVDRLEAALRLDCRSGNIKFSVRELGGNVTGKTRSGNIIGALRRDTRAVFLLQSSDVHNQFPNAAMPEAGVPVVDLSSRSGTVRVKQL